MEEAKPKGILQSVKSIVLDRLLSFTMILGIGFLLLVSLVISAGLSAVQHTLGNMLPLSQLVLQIVNLVISIGLITVLFALMFKFVPDAEIAWHDVWLGAFGTAILFAIGKTLIGLYLGNSNVISSCGAAGSLVLLLLWIYYSAQILFFCAEFTQVYANRLGSKVLPEGGARAVEREARQVRPPRQQPSMPLPAGVRIAAPSGEKQLEKENRQTVRIMLGMLIASFVPSVIATVFGFKKD